MLQGVCQPRGGVVLVRVDARQLAAERHRLLERGAVIGLGGAGDDGQLRFNQSLARPGALLFRQRLVVGGQRRRVVARGGQGLGAARERRGRLRRDTQRVGERRRGGFPVTEREQQTRIGGQGRVGASASCLRGSLRARVLNRSRTPARPLSPAI